MNHHDLSDELRTQLIESAAWGKAGITPRLTEEVVNEKKKSAKDKKEDKKEGGDPKAFGREKGDKSQTHSGEDDTQCEETAHACPLCASELSEAIDEERLLEHLNIVVGLVDRLSQLQEGDEDIDTVIDETLAELLLQNEEA